MRRFLFFALLLPCFVNAQEIYDVSKIPAQLMANASVVIRNEEQKYEVKNPGNAVMEYKTAVTIINKNGENASNMHEFYDSFSSISNLKATLYDAKGIKIKEYRSSDFKDRSAVSDISIYEDSRVKFLEFLHTSYPYTIEYSYSVSFSGIRSYPSWYPASTWGYAVEQSKYTFIVPETMTFKYLKSKGIQTDSLKIKGKTQYTWSCKDIAALEYEPMSTGLRNALPWVLLAPNQFEYDDAKANIETWKNLGTFMSDLSKGLQVLPEAAKQKVHSIVQNAKSPKDKIKLLYNYLQENTRYVSVQLGIGGYKPIAAEKVAAVSYGDCKALSNYMKAMLEEAGIKSHLVVIGNDMPSLNKDFASMNQANHMILCVPLEKDTTWLECTSQYVPAGYIGDGNSDRTVLLVTDEGGKLAQTPAYKPTDNYQKRVTKVVLTEEGNAEISIATKYGNAQYEDNIRMLVKDPTEQRKTIINRLNIPNLQITNLNYAQSDKSRAEMDETLTLKSSQILTKGADKLFLTLNLLNIQDGVVTAMENRKTFFSVPYGYSDNDEITYTLPKGYQVEFLPKDIIIESEFGMYKASFVTKDNTIVYTRNKTMTSKKYPPEKYNEYVAFAKKIYQADKLKGILAKAE